MLHHLEATARDAGRRRRRPLDGAAAAGRDRALPFGRLRDIPSSATTRPTTPPCTSASDCRPRPACASANPRRPELDADPRPHRFGGLQDGVLPGALAGAAHHDQVAAAEVEPDAAPTTVPRAQRSRGPRRATRSPPWCPPTGCARSCHRARRRCRCRRGSSTARQSRTSRRARPGSGRTSASRACIEQWVRQRVVLAVPAEQPRHVDHPLVHLPTLGMPRHAPDEPEEEVVRTR